MAEQPASLDARLAAIERTLADIDGRLRALEHGVAAPAAGVAPIQSGIVALPHVDVAGTAALAGRVFVLLAGAYLLRALTESGVLSRSTGATLGLTYALTLLGVADRVAPRQRAVASLLGGCTVLISLPLIWEITIRFEILNAAMSALALAATAAVVLAVAWRRELRPLAWIATAGACLLAGGLIVASGTALPFTAFLIALGIATLWLGYDREWTGLRWVAALFADLAVFGLIWRALAEPPLDSAVNVLGMVIASLVGYLGSIGIRTLVRNRNVLPFEATQAAVLLAVGLTGAVSLAPHAGAAAVVLGPLLLLMALASYAVAFIHREWHARAANYYFYTTLALVFAITGGNYMFEDATAAVLWVLLALGMAAMARRYGRTTIYGHAIFYLVVGAWTTGLAPAIFRTLFGSIAASSASIDSRAWLVAAALLASWWMAASARSPQSARYPRTVLMFLVIVVATGACVMAMRAMLLPMVDAALQPALVATVRTATFAAGAVLVAFLGTRPVTRECGWLLYPTLGWGLLKLLFEDFRVSPPSLLFVAFALYGLALIIAPRVAKRPALSPL